MFYFVTLAAPYASIIGLSLASNAYSYASATLRNQVVFRLEDATIELEMLGEDYEGDAAIFAEYNISYSASVGSVEDTYPWISALFSTSFVVTLLYTFLAIGLLAAWIYNHFLISWSYADQVLFPRWYARVVCCCPCLSFYCEYDDADDDSYLVREAAEREKAEGGVQKGAQPQGSFDD